MRTGEIEGALKERIMLVRWESALNRRNSPGREVEGGEIPKRKGRA